ncbi:hypothetical protein NBRC116583_33610 [Arenicella sp. 4NH20-0111]|uniref:VanZ family protein n=1 Tax=Arenicella sp. 4NH20-0111 TaxID=3127648 RepID=UPI00310290C6
MKAALVNSQVFVRRLWLPVTLLILAAITFLSLTPIPELPDVPGNDKAHHLISYGLLMVPAFLVGYAKRVQLMFVFFLWSGAIELVQPYVNRFGEWADLTANGMGLLIGAFVGMILSRCLMSSE